MASKDTDYLYQCLKEHNVSGPIQLQMPIARLNLLDWLEGQISFPKWYWKNREHDQDQEQIAACGSVLNWDSLEKVQQDLSGFPDSLRAYGGWAFKNKLVYASPWEEWPAQHFFLPRWELRQDTHKTVLCINLIGTPEKREQELKAALELLCPPKALKKFPPRLTESFQHDPKLDKWLQMLSQAQVLLHQGNMNKLVLSRLSNIACPELGLEIMAELLTRKRSVYHFWFQPSPEKVLWGASPERLYARKGQAVVSEALAGTRVNTQDLKERDLLSEELLHSPKDRTEHQKVIDFLENRLRRVCQELITSPLKVITAGPVQHLYCSVKARLNPGTTDSDLVTLLHPTPAVNGDPAELAPEYLERLEHHERGWYTGGLGWISKDSAEWAVTLRTALWQKQQLHFFTGAGIMPDSNAQAEWRELDAKLVSLTSLFRV